MSKLPLIPPSSQGFTGRHMLLTMLLFFGIIVAVNFAMAWYASSSWSGLVVENTYVASQQFNAKTSAIRAMNASGLVGTLSVLDGLIAYDIKYADGSPAVADKVVARFKRPVGEHQDFEGVLGRVQKGRFELFHSVLPGDWIVEVISTDSGVPIMHEAQRIHVGDGPR